MIFSSMPILFVGGFSAARKCHSCTANK